MKFEKSIHINCPPEQAFTFATDFSNASKWMVGFVESKLLTDGPAGAGTVYMFASKFLGQKIEMKSEVTVWEPPTRYAYKGLDGPFPVAGNFTFKAEGGGTLVTVSGEAEPGGFFKLAEGMLKGQMDKQMTDTLEGLKKALEG